MDVGLLYSLWTLSLDYIYNKVLNLHCVGKTNGYRYDVIFIMVDISEVSCAARNDKSPKVVV